MTTTIVGSGAQLVQLQGYVRQQQDETNWCWAAVTSSVNHYYLGGNPNFWTQCAIAAKCLGLDCCQFPYACDVPYYLDASLSCTGNLVSAGPGAITFAELMGEIDKQMAVCCHISWNGGGGHFVAIVGYDQNTKDVLVADPFYGVDLVPYDTFVSSYNGMGTWDYTYLTKA